MNSRSRLYALALGIVAISTATALSSGSKNIEADVLASTSSTQILSIELSDSTIEVEVGESYDFTAYSNYSTQTIETKVYWELLDDSDLGTLSCADEYSKTCTFKAGDREGKTTLEIKKEDETETHTDSATITVIETLVNPFTDTLPDWASTAIIRLSQVSVGDGNYVINGYDNGDFGAGDDLQKGQIITLIYRLVKAMDLDDSSLIKDENCDVFLDVDSEHYANEATCYFYHAGWLEDEVKELGVKDDASRGLTSYYMDQAFGDALTKAMDIDDDDLKADFADLDDGHAYFDSIAVANTVGYMTGQGDGTFFEADSILNRAEASVVLYRVDLLIDDLVITDLDTTDTTETDDGEEEVALLTECENEDSVRSSLETVLGNTLSDFELREFNTDDLVAALDSGDLELSLIDQDGQFITRDFNTSTLSILADNATIGMGKTDDRVYETLEIGQEWAYGLNCGQSYDCGAITILDDKGDEIEGMVLDENLGLTFFEPASNLISMSGGSRSEADQAGSCHMFYNGAKHEDVLAGADDEEYAQETAFNLDIFLKKIRTKQAKADGLELWELPIILDADAEFYDINHSTVWSRQRSVLSGVNIYYSLGEALGNGNFAIIWKIAGQETWLSGYGPTEDDPSQLIKDINDEDYYMINHPEQDDNEVSYFYVGYDMDGGVAGVAYKGDFCDDTNERNHAWGQQIADADGGYQFATLYGRQIVMMHEIGHVVDASHADGIADTCGNGIFSNLCGSTAMKSGAAGGVAPDFRRPFFSEKNSESIAECVDSQL